MSCWLTHTQKSTTTCSSEPQNTCGQHIYMYKDIQWERVKSSWSRGSDDEAEVDSISGQWQHSFIDSFSAYCHEDNNGVALPSHQCDIIHVVSPSGTVHVDTSPIQYSLFGCIDIIWPYMDLMNLYGPCHASKFTENEYRQLPMIHRHHNDLANIYL